MKYDLKVQTPGDIELTLTVTMELRSWLALRNQIKGDAKDGYHPAWDFHKAIDEMIEKAQTHFAYEPQ